MNEQGTYPSEKIRIIYSKKNKTIHKKRKKKNIEN